jgi:5-methylcytosine-specific restriction endonuclease McrA
MAGGNYTQVNKYIKEYNINTNHFTGQAWNKGNRGNGKPRIELKDILKKNNYFQSYKLKKRLFAAKLKPQHCEECGWNRKTKDGRMPLELDHINGDSRDNRIENLRILCPNCHSLKPTHRGRNIKK